MDGKVEVFDFVYRDKFVGSYVRRTSTLEWIATLNCDPIPGSGRRVPAAFIASEGFLQPPKMGETTVQLRV